MVNVCTLRLLHSSMGWDGLINKLEIHDITTIVEINDQCNSFDE